MQSREEMNVARLRLNCRADDIVITLGSCGRSVLKAKPVLTLFGISQKHRELIELPFRQKRVDRLLSRKKRFDKAIA